MTTHPQQTLYLVRQDADEAQIKVIGRAVHLNCRPVGRFLRLAIKRGVRHLYVDFADCQGMDSTFMGMLASTAMEAIRQHPPAEVVLTRMDSRNSQLVRDLGLGRLVRFAEDAPEPIGRFEEQLENDGSNKHEILAAHESLVEADEGNLAKFENVLSFLRKEVDGGEEPE